MPEFYLYILKCSNGSYHRPHRRSEAHPSSHHRVGDTGYNHRRPVELGGFPSRAEAIRHRQKGWTRRKTSHWESACSSTSPRALEERHGLALSFRRASRRGSCPRISPASPGCEGRGTGWLRFWNGMYWKNPFARSVEGPPGHPQAVVATKLTTNGRKRPARPRRAPRPRTPRPWFDSLTTNGRKNPFTLSLSNSPRLSGPPSVVRHHPTGSTLGLKPAPRSP